MCVFFFLGGGGEGGGLEGLLTGETLLPRCFLLQVLICVSVIVPPLRRRLGIHKCTVWSTGL